MQRQFACNRPLAAVTSECSLIGQSSHSVYSGPPNLDTKKCLVERHFLFGKIETLRWMRTPVPYL